MMGSSSLLIVVGCCESCIIVVVVFSNIMKRVRIEEKERKRKKKYELERYILHDDVVFILNDYLNTSLMPLFTPIICYQQRPFEIYYRPSPKLDDKQRLLFLFHLTQVFRIKRCLLLI